MPKCEDVNLLDSLLDAIVRLEGDALVMHVGEKPYVVTTSSPLTAPRGPLSWGQVELSSRVLTADAVLGMLGQILPLEERQVLEEIGAVQYQIPPPAGVDERFSVVAARGGDDVWLEVRRRTKPEPVAEPVQAVTGPAVPAAEAIHVVGAPAGTPAAAYAEPVAALPTPTAAELTIEQEDEEEEEDVFEIVPDFSQSAPTDDEVDALLASMAPAAAVQGDAPSAAPSSNTGVSVSLDEDEQPVVFGADELVAPAIQSEAVAARPERDVPALEPAESAIEIPLVLDAIADAPAVEDAAIFLGAEPVAQPHDSDGTTSGGAGEHVELAAAVVAHGPANDAAIVDQPELVASTGLVEAADVTGDRAVAEAPVNDDVELAPLHPFEEPATVLETPAVAESSAIADARAAFEAFTLTAPEAVSQMEEEPEPAAASTSAQREVLPFEVEPVPDLQPVEDAPVPIASEAPPVLAPAVPTAPVADVSPAAAESPAVAETLALAAAAAALDAAAAIEALVNGGPPRADEPTVGAGRADDVSLRRPSALAGSDTRTHEPAITVQESPAPVEPPVAPPAIAARRDVRSIPASRGVPPVSDAPPPQPPAMPIAPARVDTAAPASTTQPGPAQAPAHGKPPAIVEESRPALVVPISRSPVRPEAPMQAPAASLAPLEHMLRIAAARGASTVYVVAQSKPMIRVDGEISVLDSEPLFSTADVERVVMDLAPARGREQAGPVEWMSDVPEVGRVRCVTFHDHRGPGVIFRMIPPRAISVDQLGLSPEVQSLCALPDGLVLVAGARASGKSTLLSAFVDLINRTRSDHVITVESQINFVHESRKSFVSQREVRGDAEAAASAVRSAFREDPDVLVIEDLRTAEIVSVAVEAAESGRLVLGSLSAPSTVAAIERLVELFSPERRAQVQTALAGALRGVVAQVLLRKMKGGRIAAREVLLNTPAVASLVLENRMFQLPVALEAGRRHGMVPLNDSLAALVRDGTVHVAEAYRKALDREALLPILKREGIDTSFAERLA